MIFDIAQRMAFGPARVNGGAGVEPLIDGEIAGDNLAPAEVDSQLSGCSPRKPGTRSCDTGIVSDESTN